MHRTSCQEVAPQTHTTTSFDYNKTKVTDVAAKVASGFSRTRRYWLLLLALLQLGWGVWWMIVLSESSSSLSLPDYDYNNNNNYYSENHNKASTADDDDNDNKDRHGYTWNSHGCQEWPRPRMAPLLNTTTSRTHSSSSSPPPTALAVTIAKSKVDDVLIIKSNNTDDDMRSSNNRQLIFICNNIPTQLAYFLEPQGIDLLLLLDFQDQNGKSMSFRKQIVSCLKLTPSKTFPRNHKVVWNNLDNNKTTLTTYEYKSETGRRRVFLSENYVMPFPEYIQRNRTILQEKMEGCPADANYVQGTRYYTGELLQLAILQGYDYWLKIDTDIVFNGTIPFNMLHDMRIKGALFAHTAEYRNGDGSCVTGIKAAMESFIRMASGRATTGPKRQQQRQQPEWAKRGNWTGACSAGVPAFDRMTDQYYTNFVIGDARFFQSEPVRQFGTFLNEFYPGFFRYRWTDQLFFHLALGLFLGPDFRTYVADYTDLRCKHNANCWQFWGPNTKGKGFCESGGYFDHTKDISNNWDGRYPNYTATRYNTPFQNKYVDQC